MEVKIKFKAQGSSSALGNFAPGDIATVPAALAHHLVEEARCAEYVVGPPPGAVESSAKPAESTGFVGKVMQRITRRKPQS